MHSCDIDRVGLDGASELEKLLDRCARYAEEIAVLQDRARWISAEERLPGNGEKVLCWYEYFRYGEYNRMYQTFDIGYQFGGSWGGEVARGQRAKVLAWIPLPKPPKMEKRRMESDQERLDLPGLRLENKGGKEMQKIVIVHHLKDRRQSKEETK